ncbi:MAG: hypothetical protein GX445_07445 [Elusimicrobia bacterium]|nr:hypothetical protein [Elusimicrobiota bacterium]
MRKIFIIFLFFPVFLFSQSDSTLYMSGLSSETDQNADKDTKDKKTESKKSASGVKNKKVTTKSSKSTKSTKPKQTKKKAAVKNNSKKDKYVFKKGDANVYKFDEKGNPVKPKSKDVKKSTATKNSSELMIGLENNSVIINKNGDK